MEPLTRAGEHADLAAAVAGLLMLLAYAERVSLARIAVELMLRLASLAG
jgi:hypothetical protein